ncbi:MAG: 2-oxoglutarate dehydrogenase complex dihydrolipoyllysine-residue succinyltransferase [Deltaproteobacteria bacterium]|nr:2-oxoglutarate dehydrogenase complex dihydrolipoyllysine-residue succinyltransferase [Deltaproteobacteria bacterium]
MAVELRVPQLGESISQGEILRWLRADGDLVAVDEVLLELETDKTTVEIPAPSAGVLRILRPQGAVVEVGEVIATIDAAGAARPAGKTAAAPVASEPVPAAAAAPAPMAQQATGTPSGAGQQSEARLGPAARRRAAEKSIAAEQVAASGPGGRATKTDVLAAVAAREAAAAAPPPAVSSPSIVAPSQPTPPRVSVGDGQQRTRMSRLRRTIADRLVAAQHTAAILTTFNEIDMSAVMELRARHKERFQKTYGVSLGFMSLFARACVMALRDVPVVGSHIDGDDVVTSAHVHLGIAASTDRGLVVPVVRNADLLGLGELEREIARLAALARDGKLTVEDLSGGTFTISNGGVFGSLLSTPILNPPQSGILGMHKIEKRPVVVNDQIVIRPMMYVALSYDHRIVDGRDAVTYLVRVKERIEDPSRLLLEI